MDWEDLRIALAVHRAGTLTGAAKTLEVDQATVSRKVKKLEESIGVRVFDKLSRGYSLTVDGRDVIQAAERMEAEALALGLRVTGRDEELAGVLRIATFDLLADWCCGILRDFAHRYPDIELELVVDNEMASLASRDADVALRLQDSPPETLIGRRIARVEYALYSAPVLADGDVSATELPWLGWHPAGRWTDTWMEKNVPGARVRCRLSSPLVFLGAVRAGLGVGFLPRFIAARDPQLVELATAEHTTHLWLLTHPQLRRTRRIKAFIEHVFGALRGADGPFAGG